VGELKKVSTQFGLNCFVLSVSHFCAYFLSSYSFLESLFCIVIFLSVFEK